MKYLIGTLEQGTHAEKAALRYLKNHSGKIVYCQTITEIFNKLRDNKINKGVIPLINKASGYVGETLRNLRKYSISIEQSIELPVEQYLCCLKETKKEGIKEIISHQQAIIQCSKYIQENYKNCRLVNTKNTAYAIKQVSRKKMKNSAAIGPKHTIKKYNLKIISKDISNKRDNRTLFAVITLS